MDYCNCSSDVLCSKCISVLMPYFTVSKLEFNALNNNCSEFGDIRYDEYFSPCKLSKLASRIRKRDFFLMHFNVRSLPKNKDKIEEFLVNFDILPDAIAISETN